MAGIFGALGLNDNDRVFRATVGQEVIFEVATSWVDAYNRELDRIMGIFIEETTEAFKRRFKLPGGGYLMERDRRGQYGSIKTTGQWDVAFPLKDYGAEISGDDVAMAYMTVQELDNHIRSVSIRNTNTVRFQLLYTLFNNTQKTFQDQLHGALSIEPLANGDSVVYPAVLGAEDEATDDHYLELGATTISDTDDPYPTMRDELEEHFGAATGGENIVVFNNNGQTSAIRGLTGFVEVPDRFIRVGDDTDVPEGLPNVPGRILGRHEGCWCVEWRWIPSNYLLGIHMEAPKPVVRRRDPADTGLEQGLALIAREESNPFERSVWRHRFGFGVGNRLNGVMMEVSDGGTYTIPTGYT